ncbi:serine hydrolase domain-containing protein [Acidicapsa dinghuensis]|uniref:Serine hydrolase domain-containing protein n=1 Tax=Acidicapsa dinghuensis TaxID=2218256 RepID=A0ABW1EHT2_9BACT|nr:serine hydrolase domain-containing protein [Acidicapsa dinghuensis]
MTFESKLKFPASDERGPFAQAYAVLEEAIQARAFPGCAFGVLQQGNIVLLDALGHFTYWDEGANTPAVTPNTVYDIASVTKIVATTSAAMLLYQSGNLDLNTPLGEILPGFIIGRDSSARARKVTIRHLLAHNSGLPGYVPMFKTANSAQELLRECLHLPIEAEPGERAEYSDPGFILLGKALETILHEGLASWTAKHVFSPLGMNQTLFTPSTSIRPEIPPTEIDATFRHRRIQGEVQDEHAWLLGGVAGHAGLFSNVPDLLRFTHAILNPAEVSLFSREMIETFAHREPPVGSSQALGWDTPSQESSSGIYFSPNSIGHLGYSGCSLWIDRDAGIGVTLLTNRTWPGRSSQLIRSVRPAFHNAVREALERERIDILREQSGWN